MNEEKTLKWRLSEKPTSDNLLRLVEGGIITKDEAKKILLDEGVISQSDIESIKGEISLLRKMVLELSEKTNNQTTIVKIFEKEIPNIYPYPYGKNPPYWYRDNIVWCMNNAQSFSSTELPNITNAVAKLNL